MTPTPPSNSSSSAHNSPDGQFRVVRKRNRIPLSCQPCRHRKLKCNRSQPCDNCLKRGDSDACAYATPIARKKSLNTPSSNTPDEMQNRIDRLEGLVLSLMTNGPQAAGPVAAVAAITQTGSIPASSISGSSSGLLVDTDDTIHEEMDQEDGQDAEVDKVANSIGIMKVDGPKNVFISEAHWLSILAEISEVKNYFTENKKQYDESFRRVNAAKASTAPAGLFPFNAPPSTKAEILRSFPSKGTTDILIARFFEVYNFDPMFQIIHGPTYQKQYDRHWPASQETEVVWLGLTFAMMMIALVSYQRNEDEPIECRGRTDQMYRDYKRLATQSLALADTTYPVHYILETLLLFSLAEIARYNDAETSTLFLVTTTVRLATKMGYHRDSKFFPDVSPFQGEMKRRVWGLIKYLDLRVSMQFGLSPIVRTDVTNTENPRNLYDDEFSEDVKELPLSRPLNEAAPIVPTIYMGQLTDVGLQIIEEIQKLEPCQYETIMSLDRKLREVHENIPQHLKMRTIEESLNDPINIILKRYTIEIIYLRFVCLLHRKYGCGVRYPYSRRAVLESAMDILQHQATLFAEQRPEGRLAKTKFFVAALNSQDFLLPAMLVCMDLYRAAECERTGRSPLEQYEGMTKAAKLAAVEQSLRLWDSRKEDSYEALKATGVLTAMVQALREQDAKLRNHRPYNGQSFSSNNSSTSPEDSKLAPEHSAAMTLGMLSSGGALTPNPGLFGSSTYDPTTAAATTAPQTSIPPTFMTTANLSSQVPAPSFFMSLFNNVGNVPVVEAGQQNFAWDAWDSLIQASNPLDPNGNTALWPMNFDPAMDPAASATVAASTSGVGSLAPLAMYNSSVSQEQQQQQQQQQQQGAAAGALNGTFTTETARGGFAS